MILGRASELKYLNTYYGREESQILVVYGCRNVGKTALLRQFIQNKPSYYYRARAASEREQRYQWGRELEKEKIKVARYPAYTEIFDACLRGNGEKKIIIVDEFQHIIKANEIFIKEINYFLHDIRPNAQIMFILCSSSVGWVENTMTEKIGDSAYTISGLLKIRELGFEVMMEYFPGFSMQQGIEAYAVLGGLPGLWKQFDDKIGIKENICRYILNKDAFLYGEGQRMVEEELRELSVYNTILASLAAGNLKLNDLYRHTGFSRAKISVYLKNLIELELVEKVFSYDTEGKANAQKGIYRICSHFVHFYFTYLYPNLSSLERLTPGEFYNKYIEFYFKDYVADYFKVVCRQYIEKWSKWGSLPIEVDKMGEWIGKFGNIDVVAQDESGKTIVGICSWEKPIVRYDDYEWLLFCAEKAKLQTDYVYLFSVQGFEEKLLQEAKEKQKLKLISMDEM
ncbi:ATP-binding protein [Parablautia intestinalis]|uniref:ATP-binding protein n=1 Tax=Parablautia intestinalis TaxID=2320100 RepID=A0A3A9AFA4_9FIRM|nr:ATP-binding protein [Parablautia intestinalis]RKI90069.1 ATP-binding protein [Parablautia intestinalis]